MKSKANVLLLMALLATATVGVCGCSDDDEDDTSITVNFQLQDEEGNECYSFSEGDNIVFRLELKNNTDSDAIIKPIHQVIGFNAFRVYSKSGKDMGTPWDSYFTNSLAHNIIGARSFVVVVCPWFDTPSLYDSRTEYFYSGIFYKTEEKVPLPKGEYYSKFDVQLNNRKITCKRSFRIQ